MAFNSLEYKTNLLELTGRPGGADPAAIDELVAEAVHAEARYEENQELLGLQGGSVESVLRRGKALADHNQAVFRRAAQGRKDDTATLLAMLDNQLADLEGRIAGQYGENFAEDLFSDLHEQGLVDQEEYDRIMAIGDQDERRRAIARIIQEGLENGTITDADLEGHPWAQEWLAQHAERQIQRNIQASELENGQRSIESTEDIGLRAAARNGLEQAPDLRGDLETAARERTHDNDLDLASQDAFANFDLGSLDNS